MGILDSIVGWIAEQIMNLLDLTTGAVLGALGCDMSVFLRYFPAAETMYDIFVAIGIGFILLNLVWQLFKNYGAGIGLSAEDPGKLLLRSILFLFLAYFSDQILALILQFAGTPYTWVVDASLPPIEFANFASVQPAGIVPLAEIDHLRQHVPVAAVFVAHTHHTETRIIAVGVQNAFEFALQKRCSLPAVGNFSPIGQFRL